MQRYEEHPYGGMEPNNHHGEWVRYADAHPLAHRNNQLIKENARLQKEWGAASLRAEQAEAETQRLKRELGREMLLAEQLTQERDEARRELEQTDLSQQTTLLALKHAETDRHELRQELESYKQAAIDGSILHKEDKDALKAAQTQIAALRAWVQKIPAGIDEYWITLPEGAEAMTERAHLLADADTAAAAEAHDAAIRAETMAAVECGGDWVRYDIHKQEVEAIRKPANMDDANYRQGYANAMRFVANALKERGWAEEGGA